MGNEHREWEIEKWEQKQRTGNKVTDRARVQVRFCSIVHFPFSLCSFPILVASVSMSLFRLETSGGVATCKLFSQTTLEMETKGTKKDLTFYFLRSA